MVYKEGLSRCKVAADIVQAEVGFWAWTMAYGRILGNKSLDLVTFVGLVKRWLDVVSALAILLTKRRSKLTALGKLNYDAICLRNELISSERRFFEERESAGPLAFPFSEIFSVLFSNILKILWLLVAKLVAYLTVSDISLESMLLSFYIFEGVLPHLCNSLLSKY